MTPHINAKKEDIASVVLMPGDPLRAKFIAETFLENYKLVNEVRNMLMYTGIYKGKRITIAGSGMGCPSIGIYSYELFKFYDVDAIVRVGSAGAYSANLKIYDIFNVKEAFGENQFAKLVAGIDTDTMKSTDELYELINKTAEELNMDLKKGRCHSSDVFYRLGDSLEFAKKHNLDVVEMESYALFSNAVATGKKAACLLTISDSFVTHEVTTAEERQNNFLTMMKLGLEAVVKIAK